VGRWDSQTVGQPDREAVRWGYGLSVVPWSYVPVCPWPSGLVPPSCGSPSNLPIKRDTGLGK